MKYTNISRSLGWTETIDTQEGIFLQPVEAAKIEKDLAPGNAAAGTAGVIAARDQRIKELEARNGVPEKKRPKKQCR